MKKLILAFATALSIYGLSSCSGDYLANPSSNANNSLNPLNPLDSSGFNWNGSGVFSAKIDDNYFSADSAHLNYVFSGGYNIITATSGKTKIQLNLKDIYTDGVFGMAYGNVLRWGTLTVDSNKNYFSYFGNAGQVYIIQAGPKFKGKFYFQAVDTVGGNIKNVTEGWFSF